MRPTSRLKESFVAGLVLVAPLAVTLYILRILVSWSLQFVNPVVAELVRTLEAGEGLPEEGEPAG